MKKNMTAIQRLYYRIINIIEYRLYKLKHPKSDLILWAEREIKLVRDVEELDGYTAACYKSALKALKVLDKDEHSKMSIGYTKNILNKLIDWKPLTPITDQDIWTYSYMNKDKIITYQSDRMSSLFLEVTPAGGRTIVDNGQYICVDAASPVRATYHTGLVGDIIREMYPISLPYTPSKPIEVYCTDNLSDWANGDLDTMQIINAVLPDGTKVEINRYFKSTDTWWEEIDLVEWLGRLKMEERRLSQMRSGMVKSEEKEDIQE